MDGSILRTLPAAPRLWLGRITAWAYGAWLTYRYVDEYGAFPAIRFSDGILRVRVHKAADAHWRIGESLVIAGWMGGGSAPRIILDAGARLDIAREFRIGQEVRIYVAQGARLDIAGRVAESGSGIAARAMVMVRRSLRIGQDCIIAWDTSITDSDWHQRIGGRATVPTVIGDHVWIGAGARVLAGAEIGADSIVASGAIVPGGVYPERSLLAGVPARAVASDIPGWQRDLAPEA